MSEADSQVGGALGARFGLSNLRVHVSRSLASGSLAVTELISDVPTAVPTASMAHDDAFLVGVQLSPSDHEMWFAGRPAPSPPFTPGETCFYDLRRDPTVFIRGPYHSLQFYVPRTAMNEAAEWDGAPAIEDLRYDLAAPLRDPAIRHLAAAVRPAFSTPGAASGVFLDHVLHALAAHVAHRYGHAADRHGRRPRPPGPVGLAGWQLNRAREMMAGRLDEKVSLRDMAQACGLSVSYFARAFRISTGLPPHRWLLHRRVERAKDLLCRTGLSLSEIALACGFADQSHFTRVFCQMAGTTPAMWRRDRGPALH
ncbi:helix-turn-helix domain-containing protein [Phenylobacterium sp.]|uniref:helix-turn-helix domain-containing protein n=1 Tax=Phenylobacterium sp. TaxID=1871053 RepID=UPI00356551AE